MVSMLASCMVDGGLESRSGQTKDYIIGMCCLSSTYASLRRKSQDWFAGNQDTSNVSEWGDMYICKLLAQWASTMKIQLSMLVQYKLDLIIISM